MGLEAVTYISDFVITNPVGATDPKSQGDDHIRNIKKGIANTFPNITGAVTPTQTELNYLDGLTGVTGSGNLVASASPTLTGTLTAGAISSGAVSSTGTFTLTNTTPIIRFVESDASADELDWRIRTSSGKFRLSAYNDSAVEGTIAIDIDRSGSTVTEIELNATALDFNGAADFSSTVSAAGTITGTAATALTASHSANPEIRFDTTGAGADARLWCIRADSDELGFVTRTDAGTLTATAFRAIRSGTAVTEFEINATTLDFNGNLDVSGVVTTPNTSAQEVGTKGPQTRGISGSDSTQASDQGNSITYIGTGGHTLTLDSDPPTNAVIIIVNEGSGALTIAASGSLIFAGLTGNRTLPAGCMAAAYHRQGSGIWQIAGQLA